MRIKIFIALIFTTASGFSQNIFPTSGNVGIGTNLPLYNLDIDNAGYASKQIRWRAFGGQYGYTYSDQSGIGIANGDPYSELIYLQTDSKSLNFYTNSVHRAIINNNGNVGIGTTNPRAYLDMAKFIDDGQTGTVFGRLFEGDQVGSGTFLGVQGYATQGNDLGNVKSFSIIHNFYGETNNSINFYRGLGRTGGFMTFCTDKNIEKMRIAINGNIGIGTTNPDEKLTVKGKIHSQEVRVDMSGPLVPDYVFAEDYKLQSLQEVEDYIKTYKHLPEIPSASEIEKNGLMLAEMNMNLLKKVEELTLYMIEMKKENELQKNLLKIQDEKILQLDKKSNQILK